MSQIEINVYYPAKCLNGLSKDKHQRGEALAKPYRWKPPAVSGSIRMAWTFETTPFLF
jgi:hypothetical protein